ncbi:gamma-type small acid-soluble spore protein [Lederbergia sp. NSJ-179]|nr:gamma-type small acid-soluble spore protein [Lederbergia sp. NSJ-179]MCJ7843321.1 gamma-type small acid-soluble spore protein [Lederbergia sp. NSJ-179]
MANKKSQAGTNVENVRQQNAQSAGAQGNFGTEFGSETDVQSVKERNKKAEQNKAKNAGNFGQQ